MGRKYQSTVMIHNICFWMKKNFVLTYLFGGGGENQYVKNII